MQGRLALPGRGAPPRPDPPQPGAHPRSLLQLRRHGGHLRTRHKKISYGEITAKRLQAAGISCSVVPIGQLDWHVARADYILCGADTVSLHGWLINGEPSLELAGLAARKKKPFHIICETAKFDARGFLTGLHQPESGFDMVPIELVSSIATERGVLTIDDALKLTVDDLFGSRHGGTS